MVNSLLDNTAQQWVICTLYLLKKGFKSDEHEDIGICSDLTIPTSAMNSMNYSLINDQGKSDFHQDVVESHNPLICIQDTGTRQRISLWEECCYDSGSSTQLASYQYGYTWFGFTT